MNNKTFPHIIPYGRQIISEEDIDHVVQVLRSDYLTQGPQIPLFEKKICEKTGGCYAVAMNSATSALHVACLALGVQRNDFVWTSAISFVASSNCALYCGAQVDFVDIDPVTFNMCTKNLELKLQKAKKENCLPKVVIPVHMAGQSCDMQKIKELSTQYKFKIIEDASHAIGGQYQNHCIGSCAYSDITVFSFHPVKIITTGEGGAATTNDKSLYQAMTQLRTHGITKDDSLFLEKSHGPWYYEQQHLGLNYRMTDINASLGVSQIEKLTSFVKTRNEIALVYNTLLEGVVDTPKVLAGNLSSFHLYIIQLKDAQDRLDLFNLLREHNILVNVHYMPIPDQPYYKKLGHSSKEYPNAQQYYSKAISLPMYPALLTTEIEKVCSIINNFYQNKI